MARKLLLEINELGLPAAGEFLDMISPQYIADLVSWGRAIAAYHRVASAPVSWLPVYLAPSVLKWHGRQCQNRH